jgi:retron-type reverse transcriptase
MQTLVELLVELKTLMTSDARDKLERINKLFANPKNPAEFQVGRHFVSRALTSDVEAQIGHLDPGQRKQAIATARLVFPRTTAVRVLRHVFRDPDPSVRNLARRAMANLGLEDLAPAGVRTRDDARAYNSAAWAFGMFATEWQTANKPKPPARFDALAKYGLPKLAGVKDVAKLLGVDDADELDKLMRPGTAAGSAYVEFEIPKAKGGARRIAAPRMPLRKVQRIILDQILAKVPMHDACHGFVKGRSTVTNAKPHEGAALVIKLDLKDFFPTVHYRRVKGLFRHLGYNDAVAGLLAGLTTYRPKIGNDVVWPGVLPQGAPTSPALANLACRRLDRRLDRLAAKCGATYTRYADDLTFSFAKPPEVSLGRFLWWVDGICQQEGFVERPDKRRILRNKHQQRVTGLVVNAGVHVPRADRKRFRAILHNCKKHGVPSQARDHADFPAYLAGYAAYVHMVDPVLGKKLIALVDQLLGDHHG